MQEEIINRANRKSREREDGSAVETATYDPCVGRGGESQQQQRLISSRSPRFYPAAQDVNVEESDAAGDTNALVASCVSDFLH